MHCLHEHRPYLVYEMDEDDRRIIVIIIILACTMHNNSRGWVFGLFFRYSFMEWLVFGYFFEFFRWVASVCMSCLRLTVEVPTKIIVWIGL